MEAQKSPDLNADDETAAQQAVHGVNGRRAEAAVSPLFDAWPGAGKRCAIGVLAACACLAFAPRANAASMLRCESDDHSVSYVSERAGNERCSRVKTMWRWPSVPAAATSTGSAASASAPPATAPAAVGRIAGPARREVAARIYTYVEDGVRHYLTRMPVGVAASVSVMQLHYIETCNLCVPADGVNIASLVLDTRSYRGEIEAAAAVYGVDSALVRAVIHAESAYRSDAISRAGAQGLMQLMPATAQRFDVGDPFDAAQNIRGGVHYLSWLLRRFNGNLDFALAAYNSGEANVARYKGVPPFDETRTYVSRVKMLAERYRGGQ